MMDIKQEILIVIVLHVKVSISPPETPEALLETDFFYFFFCVKRTVTLVMYYFYVVAFYFHMPMSSMT